MGLTHIKKLLHKSIGLHSDTVGDSSIDRAINQRMLVTKCHNSRAYYDLVENNEDELGELIEEVVVPETWFFRNVTPFEVLRDSVLEIISSNKNNEYSDRDNAAPIKILSIPCSSGEEPYSIAMALSEAGLKSNDFMVDAVDISKRALKKAKRAIYGKHSFREKGMEIRDKYFEKIKSGYRLNPEIGNTVEFHQGNILSEKIRFIDGNYDVIFCRNLLIYFDRDMQKRILKKLSSLLKTNGFLFVGHAEAGQINDNMYEKIRVAKAFAFRKKPVVEKKNHNIVKTVRSVQDLKSIYDQLVEVTKKDIALSKKINNPNTKSESKPGDTSVLVGDILADVEKLINTGHLHDAEKLCESYLNKNPDSSEAYYYLGLISSLHGSNGGAESLLRKSIYLSPNNHKALSLSAALAEKRGDDEVAKSLRRREMLAKAREN